MDGLEPAPPQVKSHSKSGEEGGRMKGRLSGEMTGRYRESFLDQRWATHPTDSDKSRQSIST